MTRPPGSGLATGVAGVVLAAGAGRRLGGPKALLRLGSELLVEQAVRLAAAGGCDPVFVVLGAEAEQVLARAQLGVARTVVAADWAMGMGASLRAGLAEAATTEAAGAVILLVDQPLIGGEAVAAVRSAGQAGGQAAVATYAGRPGHPVFLARGIWAEVSAGASGDVGARAWLRSHPAAVTAVACDGTGDPADIDTPADAARYGAVIGWL